MEPSPLAKPGPGGEQKRRANYVMIHHGGLPSEDQAAETWQQTLGSQVNANTMVFSTKT